MLFFLAATIFTNILAQYPVTPFFIWGMYSQKENAPNDYAILKVTVNDSNVIDFYSPHLHGANSFLLTSPLEFYIEMKSNNGADPIKFILRKKIAKYPILKKMADKVFNGPDEYSAFLPWYKKYLGQTLNTRVYNFKIEMIKAKFNDSNQLKFYSTQLMEKWEQQ